MKLPDTISKCISVLPPLPQKRVLLPVLTGLGAIAILTVLFLIQGPRLLEEKRIHIEEGVGLKQTALLLKDERLIRSKNLFILGVLLSGNESNIQSGDYAFHNRQSVLTIIKRLATSDYGLEKKHITIHEGMTRVEMAEVFTRYLDEFDSEDFIKKTEDKEGYLFPDTYTFLENASEQEVIELLERTFIEKTADIRAEFASSTDPTFEDIIIMASIIEKEASATSRQEVSNILWKRIGIDMPLQVDAPFVYERQKGSFDLSLADLREDSEYNTYTRKGLTPTPIGNPGIKAITAAAYPQETPYLFFLTGRDGQMYYATTHSGHVYNKNLYLK